jgi:glycosylphosphatidylinositol transamidase
MALKQATGMPSGNHGLFHRFGIESVTIEGIHRKKSSARGLIVSDTMGRVIEGTFRSLNNLLERFHQSFFFYLVRILMSSYFIMNKFLMKHISNFQYLIF